MFALADYESPERRPSWTNAKVRRLLKMVRRPHLLEQDEFATRLRDAVGASTARDALRSIVAETFDQSIPSQRLLLETVQRCDFEWAKTAAIASRLNISARTLFRLRSEAVQAIAFAIERAIRPRHDGQSLSAKLGIRPVSAICPSCHRLM